MVQRAQLLLEMSVAFQEFVSAAQGLLDTHEKKGIDAMLADMFTQEPEVMGQGDMEQILGLLERIGISAEEITVLLERYTLAKQACEKVIEECPFEDPSLQPTMLTGRGRNDEEITIKFSGDIEIFVEPPASQEEDDENFKEEQRYLHQELEDWLLEDC